MILYLRSHTVCVDDEAALDTACAIAAAARAVYGFGEMSLVPADAPLFCWRLEIADARVEGARVISANGRTLGEFPLYSATRVVPESALSDAAALMAGLRIAGAGIADLGLLAHGEFWQLLVDDP